MFYKVKSPKCTYFTQDIGKEIRTVDGKEIKFPEEYIPLKYTVYYLSSIQKSGSCKAYLMERKYNYPVTGSASMLNLYFSRVQIIL